MTLTIKSQPWQRLRLLTLVLFVGLNGWGRPPMVRSQPSLRLWLGNEEQATGNSEIVVETELPCLDSSTDCLEQLTQRAITSSPKLKTLNSRIALIDERLALMAERIDYAEDRQWTSDITLDPVKLVQNLFGGGDVQRDRIAIADLEIKAATLEAARAELERQVEAEKILLGGKLLQLVLDYEAAARQIDLVRNQLETFTQQQSILRIQYRFGQGNTAQFLAAQERGERLRSQLIDLELLQQQKAKNLEQLTLPKRDRS